MNQIESKVDKIMSEARDTAMFWLVAILLVALAVICIGGAAIWGVVHLIR